MVPNFFSFDHVVKDVFKNMKITYSCRAAIHVGEPQASFQFALGQYQIILDKKGSIQILKGSTPQKHLKLELEKENEKTALKTETDNNGNIIFSESINGNLLMSIPIIDNFESVQLHNDKEFSTAYHDFTFFIQRQ